jgi:hypothetical protein
VYRFVGHEVRDQLIAVAFRECDGKKHFEARIFVIGALNWGP